MKIIIKALFSMILLQGICMAEEPITETPTEFHFIAYEIKGADYKFPAFKIAAKMPNGRVVGWDNSAGQWLGKITETIVNAGTFSYPVPSNICTSKEPEIYREFDIDIPYYHIAGEYVALSNLYCKDKLTGDNSYIGSGYTFSIGGSLDDAKHYVIIYPEKHSIVYTCFGYYVKGEESYNELCMDGNFIKNVIITPGVEQTIEFTYNFTSASANKVEKVVTSATLVGSWESCYKMGMIKNFGLYNSVKQKLDNAAKQQEKGQLDAAANIRNAALNEIEAQHGKGIDKMCGGIMIEDLRANVR